MTTAAQQASAGVYVSDDVGLEVTDGVRSRVQLGLLPIGSGIYGLRVLAADGTTVIIDGQSDVFKIMASGTISVSGATGTANSTTLDLTALSLATTPAMIGLIGYANTAGSPRTVSVQVAVGALGPPLTFTEYGELKSSVPVAPGAPRVTITNFNATGATQTAFGLYYVLFEVAM